jgi:hypothetical protein
MHACMQTAVSAHQTWLLASATLSQACPWHTLPPSVAAQPFYACPPALLPLRHRLPSVPLRPAPPACAVQKLRLMTKKDMILAVRLMADEPEEKAAQQQVTAGLVGRQQAARAASCCHLLSSAVIGRRAYGFRHTGSRVFGFAAAMHLDPVVCRLGGRPLSRLGTPEANSTEAAPVGSWPVCMPSPGCADHAEYGCTMCPSAEVMRKHFGRASCAFPVHAPTRPHHPPPAPTLLALAPPRPAPHCPAGPGG